MDLLTRFVKEAVQLPQMNSYMAIAGRPLLGDFKMAAHIRIPNCFPSVSVSAPVERPSEEAERVVRDIRRAMQPQYSAEKGADDDCGAARRGHLHQEAVA
jgi:hypothetical protein